MSFRAVCRTFSVKKNTKKNGEVDTMRGQREGKIFFFLVFHPIVRPRPNVELFMR